MSGSSPWVPSILVFSLIVGAFGENNVVDPQSLGVEYARALKKLENERFMQFRQLLFEQQQLGQGVNNRASPFSNFLTSGVQPDLQRVAKRTPGSHHIQQRAISQFKNCYFSPVQCVLLERRRRASFA